MYLTSQQQERRAARELYGDEIGRKGKKARTFIPGGTLLEVEDAKQVQDLKVSRAQSYPSFITTTVVWRVSYWRMCILNNSVALLQDAITNATSIDEVHRLEALLASATSTAEALKAIKSSTTTTTSSGEATNGAMHVE
jgi:hypothetical protein